MTNWEKELQESLDVAAVIARAPGLDTAPLVKQLREAGMSFARRAKQDDFTIRSAEACVDIAARVEKRGEFASPKQQEYAMKLIGWAKPKPAAALVFAAPQGPLEVPKLFAVLQKHTHFHAEPLKLSRKNQDTLVWVLWAGEVVGKIENVKVVLFARKLGASEPQVTALLKEFEIDPLAAAKKYGKLSGRCCSCGRDLTDPESIEAGIGPICSTRF